MLLKQPLSSALVVNISNNSCVLSSSSPTFFYFPEFCVMYQGFVRSGKDFNAIFKKKFFSISSMHDKYSSNTNLMNPETGHIHDGIFPCT